jgi:uncharacterized protein (DUF427 family)
MSLTTGSGPLSRQPAGVFNATIDGPANTIYFEDFPRHIRAEFGGETVIDTVRGKLLHETGIRPVLYVPIDDVRDDVIEPTDHTTHCPYKGDASYWTLSAGGKVAENVIWGYPEPTDGAPPLAGYVAAYWDRMDAWYEEGERIFGSIRDPYHRVDVRRSDAHVTVRAHGEVVAESDRPLLLFETGLPVRAYLPLDDVRGDLLVPSDTSTICSYKGTATYWSLAVGGETLTDVVWTYTDPIPEAAAIDGLVSFLGAGVEVEIERHRAGVTVVSRSA